MNIKRVTGILLGFAFLLGLYLLDHWIFSKWFGIAYWKWYLKNGTTIGLVTAIVTKVWGDMLDNHTGLISSHPLDYVGSCAQLIGLPVYVMGTQLKSTVHPSVPRSWLDRLLTLIWFPILVVAILIWFIIVVPLQYVVYLVCGAPIRLLRESDWVPITRLAGTQVKTDEISRKETVPAGWENVSITKSPVSMTNVLVALLFFILQAFVN